MEKILVLKRNLSDGTLTIFISHDVSGCSLKTRFYIYQLLIDWMGIEKVTAGFFNTGLKQRG